MTVLSRTHTDGTGSEWSVNEILQHQHIDLALVRNRPVPLYSNSTEQILWEASRNPQEPKEWRKPLNHKRLTSLLWMICLIGTACRSWTFRGTLEWCNMARAPPQLSHQTCRAMSRQFGWMVASLAGWENQTKFTNGFARKLWSLELFPAWHLFPLEDCEGCEGGETTNLAWEGNGLAAWLTGAGAVFGFWRSHRVQT